VAQRRPQNQKRRPLLGFSLFPWSSDQALEILAGILGFFTVMLFIVTVTAELQGGDALEPALALLAFAALLGFLLHKRYGIFTRR
jgi:hypothetical protein